MRFVFSVLASLTVLFASPAALVRAASQAVESGFTVTAQDNATYRPMDTADFGETVQLMDGSSAGTLFGPIGGIRQNSYVFGDLNGDGADDAVAIVIENQSGVAAGLEIVLAAYVNDADVPTFADSAGLGRATAVETLTVDSGVVTVSGLQVGPNDGFCCPKQPFQKQFALDGNRLVAVSPPDSVTGGGGVQVGTPEMMALKSEFPGPVLVPPADLQPFAGLQVLQARAGTGFYSFASGTFQEYPQTYNVLLIDPTEQSQFGSPQAFLAGAMSKQLYDDTVVEVDKTFTGCAATAAYCARTTFPCTGIPCIKQAEVFRGLTVKGAAARVEHVQQDHDWAWSVTWFDQAELDALRAAGHVRKSTNEAFTVTGVTLDAPGHAIVTTRETWSEQLEDAASGRVIQPPRSASYTETYVVEFLNGGWMVTRNDL